MCRRLERQVDGMEDGRDRWWSSEYVMEQANSG